MAKKKRILIVDDEPFCLKILRRLLEYNDYEVITASDGEEALVRARSENPDLILLDVMLPFINGVEVCNRLKSDPAYQKIPIIMCSAKYGNDNIEKESTSYADGYLPKPIDAETLLDKLNKLI